jgi:hypothetical protein
MTVREETELRGFTVEWAEPGSLLLSRYNELYAAESLGGPRRRLLSFPRPAWKSAASRVRLAQRALRFMYYNALPLGDGSLFLTFGKSIGWLPRWSAAAPGGASSVPRGSAAEGGGAPLIPTGLLRPTRVLRSGCALFDGAVYFGEYLDNAERHELPIYRYTPGDARVEIAHLFPAGAIRHMHGIYFDPFEGELWAAGGDVGGECRIMRSSDGFKTIDVVGSGDESWRVVSLRFTKDSIFYATDAEFTQNHIYRIDRRSGVREQLAPVEGPVFYSTTVAGRNFFAVTAERCPSSQGDVATIWEAGDGVEPHRIATFDKDLWSVRYFMPGSIDFPRGPGLPDRLLFRLTALKGDGRTFSIALS